MHFALSLLLDNNSAINNVVENNAVNIQHHNNINNNITSKKNNINNKNNKANSIKKSKINWKRLFALKENIYGITYLKLKQ